MGIWASKEAPPCGMSSFKLVHASRWNLLTMNTGGSTRASSASKQNSVRVVEMMTPEGITLSLHKGEIASQQVDIIVNSTDASLDMNQGALSRAILKAGGRSLKDECRRNAPHGIKHGDIVVTSGGHLHCQFVVHGAACSWADGHDICTQVLGKLIANSLSAVHKKKLGSIAIPAMGTGVLAIPPEVVAMVMLDELSGFSRRNPQTTLTDVRFVVYPKDKRTVQAFEKVLLNQCFAMTVETVEGVKLSLCVSNLADEQVDVMINSAGTELKLHLGPSSRSLLKRAGKTLQVQCKSTAPKGINLGEVVLTSGGQLQCQYVVHGACSHWTDGYDKCKQALGEFLTNSFKAVHQKKLTSVAFPAIGTDDLQIPPHFVAKIMFDRLLRFSHQYKSTTLKDVRFVMYFKNRSAMQEFNGVLRDHLELPAHWTAMTADEYSKLVELQTGCAEYQTVEKMFKPGIAFVIQKIQRIQNPKLYRDFIKRKKAMEEQNERPRSVERSLWHASTDRGAEDINIYGFNPTTCSKNATHCGDGVYFAVESSNTAYSALIDNGLKRVYLARVLTGEYTKGTSGLILPPERPGKPAVLFDSVVDRVCNPKIFVVFIECQAYPEYLVTFT